MPSAPTTKGDRGSPDDPRRPSATGRGAQHPERDMNEGPCPAVRAAPHRASGDLFEIWLQCRLHWLFGTGLGEPVPPKLLQILEADQGTAGAGEPARD